jgi:hypothetical protein
MLNLAVPVAVVLTVGDIAWPDKLAMKLVCRAKAGFYINDRTDILTDITGVYLPIGNFLDRFIFRDISIYNRAKSISSYLILLSYLN